MVGHQLMVISLAYYNNNLALQLYFNGSTTCYLEEVMMVPKNLLLRIQGGGGTCLRAPMTLSFTNELSFFFINLPCSAAAQWMAIKCILKVRS